VSELRHLYEQHIRIPLAGIHDIRPFLKQFGKRQTLFEPDQLLDIGDTLSAASRLKQFLYDLPPDSYTQLRCFAQQLTNFQAIIDAIDHCISAPGTVRDQASDKLYVIRLHIQGLQAKIQQRFTQIVSSPRLRHAVENHNLMIRHGRPVVALKEHYRTSLRGTVLDRSNTGATIYVEPDELVELSNELEDARFAEKKEIDHILWELTHAIIEQRRPIMRTVRTLSFIDLTYAKVRFSMDYHLESPDITSDGPMVLVEARHPLLLKLAYDQNPDSQPSFIKKVVPISPRLGEDFDLLLVTGPNTGGKTVLLKTIGLCVLMAQSGIPIPARADSRIKVFSRIFADIGDEQSIQQSLSTFSAHMRQIVHIIQRANQQTLVLLDELGAGTDPVEGAGLANAILDMLIHKGSCIVATTHLGQLKHFAFSHERKCLGPV
jgi:DNA mismatch repair protein MutS2